MEPHLQGGLAIVAAPKTLAPPTLLARYNRSLEVHPLPTKMATNGVLSLFEELIAQLLERRDLAKVDVTRIAKYAAFGTLASAPLGHFLYPVGDRAAALFLSTIGVGSIVPKVIDGSKVESLIFLTANTR
jgi:hypothetical protein